MKYSLQYFLATMLAFVLILTSCQKDEIEEEVNVLTIESISGYVLDIDSMPVQDVRVLLQKQTDSTYFVATSPNTSGFYEFDQVLPGTSDLYLSITTTYPVLSSGDITPDGDVYEELDFDNSIGVFLDPDENDDGNNFYVARTNPCVSRSTGRVIQIIDGVNTPLIDHWVYLIEASSGLLLAEEQTDIDGRYTLTSDDNIESIILVDTTDLTCNYTVYGVDETPESGGIMINFDGIIQVDVDSCKTDSDNNFYIECRATPPAVRSISGTIMVDIDGDGIGDTPLISSGNQRIELYNRSTNNVPQTPFVSATYEDSNGNFNFENIPSGEYILYYIGDGTYGVISGVDQDQEAGEPASSNPVFIPVNLSTDDDSDSLNIYTVQQANMGGCTEQLQVVEYWALCDTSIICELDRWPILVVDQNLDPIVSPQYQVEWTNLATGASSFNDWVYINDFESYEVNVSASDGCEYTLYYTRDCVQDLDGRFNLKMKSGGFAPTEQYADGEVVWLFDASTQTLTITHNLSNPSSDLVPVGTYTTALMQTSNGYALMITNVNTGVEYDLGDLSHDGMSLFMDNDVAADGILLQFEKAR